MSQRTSQFIALIFMILMLILYWLTSAGYFGPNPVGGQGTYSTPLVVPAGYAFAIWGPIYIGLIIFPIFQLIRNRDDHPLWPLVRYWYGINVILNGLWLILASYSWLAGTVAVIVFMLYTLIRINDLLIQIKADQGNMNYWVEKWVFSTYFAWVTLATVLNVSAALSYFEWSGWGLTELTWALIILPVAAIIAGMVFRKYKDIAYAAVVIWAFAALVVKHWETVPILAWLSAGVIVIFLALIIIESLKRKKQSD